MNKVQDYDKWNTYDERSIEKLKEARERLLNALTLMKECDSWVVKDRIQVIANMIYDDVFAVEDEIKKLLLKREMKS